MDGTYLRGEHVYLRALEPEDLDFIYEVESGEPAGALGDE